jgi:hypothetical protein
MNKPRVTKRGNFWQVRSGTSTRFTAVTLSDWNMAVALANKVSGRDPLLIGDYALGWQMGLLDEKFNPIPAVDKSSSA